MNNYRQHLNYLLKGAGLQVLNFGVVVILGLMLAPYVLRTLGERDYGINVIVAGLVGAFSLADLGISAAVSRFFTVAYAQKNKEECIALSNTAFFTFLLLGGIGFLGLLATALVIYYLNLMDDRLLITIIIVINGFTFCVNFPMNIFIGIVNGTMRQELIGLQSLTFRLLGALTTFLILFCGGRLIVLACAGLVIALLNMVILLRLVYVAFPDFLLNPSYFRWEILFKLIRYGLFTFLIFVSGVILNQGSILIISTLIKIEAVALFSMIALELSGYLLNLMETIMGNWLTTWLTLLHSQQDKELANKTLKLAYKMSTCFASFCAFGLIVWGPAFLMRWGGKNDAGDYYFLEAYPSLVWLTLGVWIIQCQAPNTRYLYAVAKHSFLAYTGFICNIIALEVATLLVCYGYGVESVAGCICLSMLAVRGIAAPIYACLLRKQKIIPYFLQISSYIICAGIAYVIPLIISHYLLAPNYGLLVLVGCLCSITYFPVYLLITINKTERETIRNFFRKQIS
ncbi:MAG: hypothetical protein LBI18_15020 [Planctomycetaceae bacterium]|jgi:O-antigen/teichoic acid export membrane protein|nr:hypothetical protein [Planctomycetaceae bacterium]